MSETIEHSQPKIQSRIETLIPYKEVSWHPQSKLGTFKTDDSPWGISSKLGRFLLSGEINLTEEEANQAGDLDALKEQKRTELQKQIAISTYCSIFGLKDSSSLKELDSSRPATEAVVDIANKFREEIKGLDWRIDSAQIRAINKKRDEEMGPYEELVFKERLWRDCEPNTKNKNVFAFWDKQNECLVLIGQASLKSKFLGEASWRSGDRKQSCKVRGFALPTAVGALELYPSTDLINKLINEAGETFDALPKLGEAKDTANLEGLASKLASQAVSKMQDENNAIRAIISNNKYFWKDQHVFERDENGDTIWVEDYSPSGVHIGGHAKVKIIENEHWKDFLNRATERWGEEQCRELNRRWLEHGHTATVFEDKLQYDEKHQDAARHGFIGESFGKVEIDNSVDLNEYAKLQHEFQARYEAKEIPQINMDLHQMRFRKTGRHKAIGLYAPVLLQAPHHGIAVDPRAPKSLLHEFAHAYDFQNGMVCLTDEFKPVLDCFRNADHSGIDPTSSMYSYAMTPTEVFARSWEVYAFNHNLGGSFIDTQERYLTNWMYTPLQSNQELLNNFFDKVYEKEGFTSPAVVLELDSQSKEWESAIQPSQFEPTTTLADLTSTAEQASAEDSIKDDRPSGYQYSLFDLEEH